MIKLLITGSNGFLGSNLVNFFLDRNYGVFGTDLHPGSENKQIKYISGDLTDINIVHDLFDNIKPDKVINTVAIVDLDICEQDKTLAYNINVKTAANIAKISDEYSSGLVHISTDHLFDGLKLFYKEDDIPNPINNYGLTKLEAEQECLKCNSNTVVVRTNFYGWSPIGHKLTSAEWMYKNIKDQNKITLFDNYYFTPIEISYLSKAIHEVMESDYKGIINIVGSERCSKYDFGISLAKVFGMETSCIEESKLKEDSFTVNRQTDLSLSIEKFKNLFKAKLPNLEEGLQIFKATMPNRYLSR